MAECAYMMDDYNSIRKIVGQIPEGSELLLQIGEKFLAVGLCAEAVAAYEKAGDHKAAIDACVLLNQVGFAY